MSNDLKTIFLTAAMRYFGKFITEPLAELEISKPNSYIEKDQLYFVIKHAMYLMI